MNMIFICRI